MDVLFYWRSLCGLSHLELHIKTLREAHHQVMGRCRRGLGGSVPEIVCTPCVRVSRARERLSSSGTGSAPFPL